MRKSCERKLEKSKQLEVARVGLGAGGDIQGSEKPGHIVLLHKEVVHK